jgi:hypothetical protein
MRCAVQSIGLMLALVVFALMGEPSAQERKAPLYTKEQLQQMYSDYLADEGYRPSIDEDGDVQFKQEGRMYYIGVSEDDPEYFRVVLPNIWRIESEQERIQVLVAADAVTATTKVA